MTYHHYSADLGLVHRYYKKVEHESTTGPEYPKQVVKILARYFIILGEEVKKLNPSTMYKLLAKHLDLGYKKDYRHYFLKASACYIQQNQHRALDLRDYKESIVKQVAAMIEEGEREKNN